MDCEVAFFFPFSEAGRTNLMTKISLAASFTRTSLVSTFCVQFYPQASLLKVVSATAGDAPGGSTAKSLGNGQLAAAANGGRAETTEEDGLFDNHYFRRLADAPVPLAARRRRSREELELMGMAAAPLGVDCGFEEGGQRVQTLLGRDGYHQSAGGYRLKKAHASFLHDKTDPKTAKAEWALTFFVGLC